jgi:hypothetical protein
VGSDVFLLLKLTHVSRTKTLMYILHLFEAVYKSHVLTLGKKGLECSTYHTPLEGIKCTILQENESVNLAYKFQL